MKNKYRVISEVIENEFSYEMEINRDEGVEFLINGINEGCYDLKAIKEEYDIAILDTSYDWVDFAIKTKMIWDKDSYSNNDIINYLKYYLHDIVYPESKFSSDKLEIILNTALKILKNLSKNNGWIKLKELYERIVIETNLEDLTYYHMYHLMINNRYKIEGRSERGQKEEKLFVKHKQWISKTIT